MDVDVDEVRAAVDRVGIARLLAAYADVVDRRAWADLDRLFVPDAPVHLDLRDGQVRTLHGAGELGAFVGEAMARFDFFEMAVLNAHVELYPGGAADAATGRVFIHEIRHGAEDGRRSDAYGLYQDRYRRVGDRWCFAQRHYASLARTSSTTGPDLEVLGLPEIRDPWVRPGE